MIISRLPYGNGFLFVDGISHVDEDYIIGNYTFRSDAPFYACHYKHRPVTPGVILIECMGQIGLVCHMIYLEKLYDADLSFSPVLSNVEVSFVKTVEPGEKVEVEAHKIYYRGGVLKSRVVLKNSAGEECLMAVAQLKLNKDER